MSYATLACERLGRLQVAVDMFLSGHYTREQLAEVAAEIKADLDLYDVLRDNTLKP